MRAAATQRLSLPDVTLIAVTSVNVAATVAAMDASMAQIAFGESKLLTHRDPGALDPEAQWVPIAPLASSRAYSEFVLRRLVEHVSTPFCLLIQWDGHVIDAARWQAAFCDYDYIGASWPQFGDGHDVGNGGFSLRSRALLEACADPGFAVSHPEDLAVGRHNRARLESLGLRYAPRALADAFSAERAGDPDASFGFHGVWHMPRVLGSERFWTVYRSLDERTSVRHDAASLLRQVARGRGGTGRAFRLLKDLLEDARKWQRNTP